MCHPGYLRKWANIRICWFVRDRPRGGSVRRAPGRLARREHDAPNGEPALLGTSACSAALDRRDLGCASSPAAGQDHLSATAGQVQSTAPQCRPCACPKRPEVRIGMTGGFGGFWSKTTGWTRSNGLVRQDIGIWLHRHVELNLNLGSSVERLSFFFGLGATVYPWHRGPYARLTFDMVLAGVGVQPGISVALGYSYFTKYPFGLFAEFQLSTPAQTAQRRRAVPFGGVFAYF